MIRGTYRAWSDNYNGVRVEAANGVTVAHNTLSDVTCNWSTNCAGIMLYDTANSVFEFNKISSTATGVFIKGDHAGDGWPQLDNVFRRNWIENTTAGAFRGSPPPEARSSRTC
ncbi:MAG: right-handed parallel beta-helix repeat-containing protein [Myxococcales bacterium]|nr:right-handed parallel beta-helix repeat-containing protein [Myxococcales bacterium]